MEGHNLFLDRMHRASAKMIANHTRIIYSALHMGFYPHLQKRRRKVIYIANGDGRKRLKLGFGF
jgi:hypothetical protein